ncbi:MAG: hypothetical protein M1275_03650 [Patescibacteria group bacterium]|nr:hypothetical protein [Patescibacteria group bacterium]
MLKLIFLSLLLTFVFSWEECKRTVRLLAYGLFRRRDPKKYYSERLDKFVGALILLFSIPLALLNYLTSTGDFLHKLWMLALQLLVLSLLAMGLEKFLYWTRASKYEAGAKKLVPLTFSVLGLLSPIFHPFAGLDGHTRKILAKFIFFLSLPALAGIALRYFGNIPAPSGVYLHNLDAGIALLVGSLVIRITVDFLEIYFRKLPLEKFFAYYRVALGIALVWLLTLG